MPSTVIRTFSYDALSQVLTITFVSGVQYRYLKVPSELVAEFKKAFSKGQFFSGQIRDRFPFERVTH
jgi:hypothetical protein